MRLAGSFLLLVFCAPVSFAEAKLCGEPKYGMRSLPRMIGITQPVPSLFNPDEAQDYAAGRRLAAEPGPYGHSELGFRYLARLFGYPGPFDGNKETVERWLAQEEISKPRLNRGLRESWNHWVVNAPRRLSVPLGPVSRIPGNANADIFFNDLYEQDELNRCIGQELATIRCENATGERLVQGHMVYFAVSEVRDGTPYCKIFWYGSLSRKSPDRDELSIENSTVIHTATGSTATTTKKTWAREREKNEARPEGEGEKGARAAK